MFRTDNSFKLMNSHKARMPLSLPVILTLVIISSCGLFETRTPEMPNTSRSTYEPPTTPDAVLRNISSSIIEKNSNNYIKCLSATGFRYIPDSKSLSQYGTIFANWSLNSEKFYLDNLIANSDQNASSNLFLSNTVTTQLSSDSAVTTSDYIVVFQHNKVNIPKSAIGNFTLTMRTDENSLFYITKWEDFRKHDTDFTWSGLKANFSN